MSPPLVSRSPDLQRLQDEGYDVEIRSNYLLVKHVPYVNSARQVAYGTMISELSTSGTTTVRPSTHVVSFAGGIPCDNRGAELTNIINSKGPNRITEGLTADCTFSSKPPEGYLDYHAKITAYVNMLSGWAQAIDPAATAKTFPVIPTGEEESVFRYLDTASSRAGISLITSKLALAKVAIVGLGGTGSFILDLIAKTPIQELHLYDGDMLYTHNAFRAPGAASLEELQAAPSKVEYYQRKYDVMRRGIVTHPVHLDETNVADLKEMTFVFLTMDSGLAKELIVKKLEEYDVPFIDAGMGVYRTGDALAGIVRVTASVPSHRRHVWEGQRLSFFDGGADDYDSNIQIADLNALNAVLAVLKWKKLYGFYADLEHELYMAYTIDGNHLLNEDRAC
jgi:hypothetical protein